MRRSLVCLVAFLLCAGPATAETCTYAYVIGIQADDLRKHTERYDEGFSTRETVYLYFGNGGVLEHGLAFPGKYSRGRDLHVCREMLATLPPKTYDTVVLHWPGETLTLRIGGDSPRDYHRGWTSIQFGHLRAFTGPLPQLRRAAQARHGCHPTATGFPFRTSTRARYGMKCYAHPQDMGGHRPNRPQEGAMLASTFRILALSALLAAAVMLTLTVPGA